MTTTLPTTILEGTTALYSFALVDDAGEGIPLGMFTTFRLTYYDVGTETIINGRDDQDALNAHDVILVTDPGPPLVTTVTWALQPEDTIILNPLYPVEYRVIQFTWTWDGGTKVNTLVAQFAVENVLFVA